METSGVIITFAIINTFAILLSPVIAVRVGQYLQDKSQDRKKKYDAKMNLFLTLLSYRGNQVHHNFVSALNLIDIVFYDTPKVLELWHKYFEHLHRKDEVDLAVQWQRSFLDLVGAIAISLGYTDLKQTDVDKVYTPKAHGAEAVFDQSLKENLVGYLKSGKEIFEFLKNESDKKREAEKKNAEDLITKPDNHPSP